MKISEQVIWSSYWNLQLNVLSVAQVREQNEKEKENVRRLRKR